MIPLRIRLIAAFTAVALLSSALASGIAYVLVRRAMLQRTQDAMITQVRQTVSRMVPAELPPDTGSLLAGELEQALTSPDGRVKAFALPLPLYGPIPPALPGLSRLHVRPAAAFLAKAQGSADTMVYQRVVSHGRPYLLVAARPTAYQTTINEPERQTPPMVIVSVSLEKEAADLRSFGWAVTVADSAAVVAALVLALLATRGVLRPVRRLASATRDLGEGRLQSRVEVKGRDELADLARSFNDMAGTLQETVTELRAMEASSRRFVADVSHELRTPLTSMIAVAELLAEDDARAVDAPVATGLIVEETRRLGQLVEHLIEISRFDSGAATLVPDNVVIADAVAATLAARGWTGELAVTGPADLVARVDPRRFDVIVANLAGNALKHGRPPVTLDFGPAERHGRQGFQVTVADRGPGIPGEVLSSIFDRFVKVEAARSRSEGSGLGLSIAWENAALHGGVLRGDNGEDGGAVFSLWLPIGEDAAEGEGA
ncbi:HAMP domain-containing protein [Actinomadura barringtoniae]|uniref:histidine kinase n=1 Tax=Actinomadura barringtoniae TaxID=1427535 RepID=A0A939P6I1_9ACTN|nr:HAMP domain-containing sensor histidine kinase [Actinomadura barringtoniae]MBO2446263.1 HAMP domain-containing protein [Actinomadura barringtoniae]